MTDAAAPAESEVNFRGPFTLNEIDQIEALSGVPLPKWFNGSTPEGALRRAILFVVAARDQPITLHAAGQFGGTIDELSG